MALLYLKPEDAAVLPRRYELIRSVAGDKLGLYLPYISFKVSSGRETVEGGLLRYRPETTSFVDLPVGNSAKRFFFSDFATGPHLGVEQIDLHLAHSGAHAYQAEHNKRLFPPMKAPDESAKNASKLLREGWATRV